ncbi:hypothetical protein FQA39_LY12367 [Lamprigera yunnana]|nr:hypothetical protein FQA39_LY12367 [Lamprigera yunnana]
MRLRSYVEKIKFVILLIVYLHVGLAQKIPSHLAIDWTDLVAPHSEKCIVETEVDANVARNIFHDVPVEIDRTLRCYFKCLLENMEFLLPNGQLVHEKFIGVLPDFEREIVEKCVDTYNPEKDFCDKAFLVSSCIMTVASE